MLDNIFLIYINDKFLSYYKSRYIEEYVDFIIYEQISLMKTLNNIYLIRNIKN